MGKDDQSIGLISAGQCSPGVDSGIPHHDQSVDVASRHRWPTGHIGWIFASRSEFEGRSTVFLAEGLARREKLMLVSADPKPHLWPEKLTKSGLLTLASVAEVYGPTRVVDPSQQRATFLEVLSEALDDGYAGIRVAADNSSLIATADRMTAWLQWERVADELMSEHPITGLCAFDRSTCSTEQLRPGMEHDRHHA